MSDRKYDIVIYGPTGFTGNLAGEYFFANYSHLRWAIGGRNAKKLNKWKDSKNANCDIIIAETCDTDAVKTMTSQTRVLMNCVGTYSIHAPTVVHSCITTRTHYCDLTAENFWVKENIDNYHTEAKENRVKIIHYAGFDSIPSDLGSFYCISKINRPVKKIESFFHVQGGITGGILIPTGETGNQGGFDPDPFELTPKDTVTEEQRREIQRTRSPGDEIGKTRYVSGPFVMAPGNTPVVLRSAGLAKEKNKSYGRNFVYQEYGSFRSKKHAVALDLDGVCGNDMVTSPMFRYLRRAKKPGKGPKDLEKGGFKVHFLCTDEEGEVHYFILRGKGNPAYKLAPMMLVETGLGLVHDESGEGGVLTPASGLGQTLIDRITAKGIVEFT